MRQTDDIVKRGCELNRTPSFLTDKMYKILTIILACVFLTSDALDVTFMDGGLKTKSFRSPSIDVEGTTIPFSVMNKLIFIPTDASNHACVADSTLGSTGRVIVASADGCSYSTKIRNAFQGGAAGLVIQWTEDTEPGFNFRWGGLGIRANEGINMPTVEVLFKDGKFLKDQATVNPFNTTISFRSGEPNSWKDAFDGVVFIVLFQVFLSVFEFGLLSFTIFRLVAEVYYRSQPPRGGRMTHRTILLKENMSYVYYLTIFGCSSALLYVAVDPLHSRGIYNQMADSVFTTLSLPSSFISTFLISYSNFVAMTTPVSQADKIFRKSIITLLVVSLLVFITDLVGSILKGAYVINQIYVYIAGTLYLGFPVIVIVFFGYSTIRLMLFRRSVGAIRAQGNRGNRLLYLAYVLIPLYLLWFIAVALGFLPLIQTPPGRITLFFFYFFITAIMQLAHILFIPSQRPSFFTFRQAIGSQSNQSFQRTSPSGWKPISLAVDDSDSQDSGA